MVLSVRAGALVLYSEKHQLDAQKTERELNGNPNYQLLLEEIDTWTDQLDVRMTVISSKYRPRRCPNCGLRWDLSVGSTVGFVRLSSFSWKCVDCGHIAPNINPFGRSVARW